MSRIGSQLDCGGVSGAETCIERAAHPVPDDEGDRAFEGLLHLGLAVVAVWRGRFGTVGTLRLEKLLSMDGWSGCGQCVDAVDLHGHLDMVAVSVGGDNESQLTLGPLRWRARFQWDNVQVHEAHPFSRKYHASYRCLTLVGPLVGLSNKMRHRPTIHSSEQMTASTSQAHH